jgi:hypothetical protein
MSINFDCTDAYGKTIEIQTPLIDRITAVLADPATPEPERERAFNILKYVKQRQSESDGLPELDRAAHQMLINIRITSLWSGDDYLVTVKNSDGVEHLEMVKKAEPEVALPASATKSSTVETPDPEPTIPRPQKLKAAKAEVAGLIPSFNAR